MRKPRLQRKRVAAPRHDATNSLSYGARRRDCLGLWRCPPGLCLRLGLHLSIIETPNFLIDLSARRIVPVVARVVPRRSCRNVGLTLLRISAPSLKVAHSDLSTSAHRGIATSPDNRDRPLTGDKWCHQPQAPVPLPIAQQTTSNGRCRRRHDRRLGRCCTRPSNSVSAGVCWRHQVAQNQGNCAYVCVSLTNPRYDL